MYNEKQLKQKWKLMLKIFEKEKILIFSGKCEEEDRLCEVTKDIMFKI